ncbi:MAG: thrombospondin type 3 repeat-containing protein [Bacteroidota bacterium]|nr:thrombospondin type 3 repeat-containing protein [Bacteroidota bacterium]
MKSKASTLMLSLFPLSIFFYITSFFQHSFSLPLQHTVGIQKVQSAFYLNNYTFHSNVAFSFSDSTKKDRDGDGIPDSLDKCPDEKGVLQYDGCPVPDSDNDGIADDKDECPTIAGLLKYNGCPPSDRDGDKVNDDEDKCPDLAGVARYGGCPVGDKDGDGVNDDDDKCINVPGTISNAGCPENKKSAIAPNKQKIDKKVSNIKSLHHSRS